MSYQLTAERVIAAPAETIFDGFVALYDGERPDWVTDSSLDLRPGGRWDVAFQVPDGPTFGTSVEITVEPAAGGHRLRLVQQGFPTPESRDEFAGAWPDVLAEVARRVTVS